VYTLIGSIIWNILLTFAGLRLGGEWQNFHKYSNYLDIIAVLMIIVFVIWFVYKMKHMSTGKRDNIENKI
jgi:membrane protein DedA with SNARE-associated domain